MNFFTTELPVWVSILFLVVIPIPIYLIAQLGQKGASNPFTSVKPKNVFYGILAFYLLYLTYVTIACFQGLFSVQSLPPKIMMFTAIPLLFFLSVFVLNLPYTKRILRKTHLSDLIRIHIFRLIGSFFLIMGFYKTVPTLFSLSAGLGDITVALTSIWVSNIVLKEKTYSKKVTFLWNTFGLLDILMTSFLAFWFTKLSIETGSLGVDVLTEFPFCFIPSFAPATIIFLHLCVYKKLLEKGI
ncbi:MAG: hypothetical protein AAGD17_10060 [Bacteroidota bacterium]